MVCSYLPVRFACLLAALGAVAVSGCGRRDAPDTPERPHVPGKADVGFVPTPDHIIARMLEMAEVRPGDVVYDLGCGDGRIVIAAAKTYGVKAVGIEIDAALAEEARRNAEAAGVAHLVTIKRGDIFAEDIGEATVVTLYLMSDVNLQLKPKLAKLREGSRIVSHSFDMRGARPEKVETVAGKKVYLWRVPWKSD